MRIEDRGLRIVDEANGCFVLIAVLVCVMSAAALPKGIVCDTDSDCFYVPERW